MERRALRRCGKAGAEVEYQVFKTSATVSALARALRRRGWIADAIRFWRSVPGGKPSIGRRIVKTKSNKRGQKRTTSPLKGPVMNR